MKKPYATRRLGLATLVAGLAFTATATAWWYGDPAYRPYGSGAVTYERQNTMRGHGYTMDSLAAMLDGRRSLDRDEAVRLARELEQGFGDELIGNYPPGSLVAGSRTAPWTWRNFAVFEGYARAARQAAAGLARALENEPAGEAARWPRAAPLPRRMGPHGPWGHPGTRLGSPVSPEVAREYGRLFATCDSCHMLFRGPRR